MTDVLDDVDTDDGMRATISIDGAAKRLARDRERWREVWRDDSFEAAGHVTVSINNLTRRHASPPGGHIFVIIASPTWFLHIFDTVSKSMSEVKHHSTIIANRKSSIIPNDDTRMCVCVRACVFDPLERNPKHE